MDIRMYGIFSFLMDIGVAIRKVGGLFPKEKMKFRVNCFFCSLTGEWEETNREIHRGTV